MSRSSRTTTYRCVSVATGAVAGVLIVVAGFASYLPAYRATRVDPIANIRSE